MDATSEAANFQLVDFYGFLRPLYHFLPYWISPSKRKLHDLQNLENRVFIQLLNRAKERIESGNACPSSSAHPYNSIIVNPNYQVSSAICCKIRMQTALMIDK